MTKLNSFEYKHLKLLWFLKTLSDIHFKNLALIRKTH